MTYDPIISAQKAGNVGIPVSTLEAGDRIATLALITGGRGLLPPVVTKEDSGQIFTQVINYSSLDRFDYLDLWIDYARRVGFTHNGLFERPPTSGLWLYRGASEQRRAGLSWTTQSALAKSYGDSSLYRVEGEESAVWKAFVPPSALLARLSSSGHDEWIVDPTGLEIELY